MTLTMWNIAAVASGGAIGAVARYLISGWVHQNLEDSFPWGTLLVNVLGSLLFGVLAVALGRYFAEMDSLRLFLLTGLLGAFTTFSTFSFESILLIQQGKYLLAGGNVIASVLMCTLAIALGLWLGQRI